MTRRSFTVALAALLALVRPRTAYGLMTVDRWSQLGMRDRGARVLLDGRDITDECVQFHDRNEWADVLLRNAEGRHYANTTKTGPASERLRGRVEVVFPKRTRS